ACWPRPPSPRATPAFAASSTTPSTLPSPSTTRSTCEAAAGRGDTGHLALSSVGRESSPVLRTGVEPRFGSRPPCVLAIHPVSPLPESRSPAGAALRAYWAFLTYLLNQVSISQTTSSMVSWAKYPCASYGRYTKRTVPPLP